jgi:3-oxoacyl-[acyl-carrier protein] reductase
MSARSIVITGTRKGIGRRLAERFLARGWVVAGCSRGESDLDHPGYTHYQLDVSDELAVVRMLRTVSRQSGIDVLVNNAGVAAMNHLLLSSLSAARKMVDCNFVGSFLFMRECAKLMQRSRGGRIINFSTVAVPLDLEGEALYAATKAAVESLTRIAARELAAYGVTVNAVGPTPIETDLIRFVPPDKIRALIERQAIKRFGDIADVENVIDFFIDERSSFITGQVLYLGGVNA